MTKKAPKNHIREAAVKVARPSVGDAKPSKRVVTLYLVEENYIALQKLHGRQVGKVIDELVAAYLEAVK